MFAAEDFSPPGALRISLGALLVSFLWAFAMYPFGRLGVEAQTPTLLQVFQSLSDRYPLLFS